MSKSHPNLVRSKPKLIQVKLEKDGLEVLLSRTKEKAMRLALICQLAENPNAKTISSEMTEWAINYVNYYDQIMIDTCEDKVAGSEMEKMLSSSEEEILRWIVLEQQ